MKVGLALARDEPGNVPLAFFVRRASSLASFLQIREAEECLASDWLPRAKNKGVDGVFLLEPVSIQQRHQVRFKCCLLAPKRIVS